MNTIFTIELLAFGLAMNAVGAIRYKLIGGKLDSILIVLICLNLGMFIFTVCKYSFSYLLFFAMIGLNLFYYWIYRKKVNVKP